MSENPSKEIGKHPITISRLARKFGSKEIGPAAGQDSLFSLAEREVSGIGMGVLSDGTPYLNQRGLASMCGVQNAHIGTISSQWAEIEQKPRISAVRAILAKAGVRSPNEPHVQVSHEGRIHYCYPAEICLAVMEYYAFDAGANCQTEARDNFRKLAGSKLCDLIYAQVGYDPSGKSGDRFRKWHERISLNYRSAPKGYFHVFNEAATVIYELIQAGAEIGDKFVVDISVGKHWAAYWQKDGLTLRFGKASRYPHCYPDDHPQAKSNPQESWCYPLAALGQFREWLQNEYIEGGKFATYLKGKVSRGELPPSVAALAITTLVPDQIAGPIAG